MTHEEQKKKLTFMDDTIFYGLKNLNDGFDSLSISYFSAADFYIVMERCRDAKLGIWGIESWVKNEKVFCDVKNVEDWKAMAFDSTWYFDAFNQLNLHGDELMFSASYYIPSYDF